MDERCIHELIIEQCGLCRPRQPVSMTTSWSRATGSDAPWFEARYGGTCVECGDRFDPGDMIRATGAGEYECSGCGGAP
jgi:hypothetical protein